jgi:cephalosporin hydroxylase
MNAVHKMMSKRRWRTWRGRHVIKLAEDLLAYAEIIQTHLPDTIVETGTAYGGSSAFFADMLHIFNPTAQVITIDTKAVMVPDHPMVTYIEGSSTSPEVVEKVKSLLRGKVMVVLDSSHRGRHVEAELNLYSPMVTKGQFVVVEDVYYRAREWWPKWAVDRFLANNKNFKLVPVMEKLIVGVTRGGWIQRVADE